jgi:polygalacturonase
MDQRDHEAVDLEPVLQISKLMKSSFRPHVFNLTDFGAIGDGSTVNTKSFEEAVAAVNAKAADGGAQVVVPPGRWLTAPFNVTSRMTLFLCEGATILAVQV